jgi:CRISPR-associated protein Cas1
LKQLMNTLYIMTQQSYLRLDHDTLKVEVEGKEQLQVPIHHLGGVVCIGNVMVSPAVIHRCAEDGMSLVFLDRNGHFSARVQGKTSGNVLLRVAQHQALAHPPTTTDIARSIVAAKIQNSRNVVMRGARQARLSEDAERLRKVADNMASALTTLARATTLDEVRGREGEAAHAYFSGFDALVLEDRETFAFKGRNRRPPRDPVNALLSFVYALLTNDCVAGVEGVGLDPQVGYLHALRPGRPALALDLLEELRAPIGDRLALTLVNLRKVTGEHFESRPGGAVLLNDVGRRTVAVAYQKRKAEEVYHPGVDQQVPIGLIPHVQARLLARHLRGEVETYLPFVWK